MEVSGNRTTGRTLAHLLAVNGRYRAARLLEHVDTWNIRHFAATRYAAMRVPAWNDAHVKAITSDHSPLARLLALDENAVVDADRVLAGEYRLFGSVIQTGRDFPDWHLDYLSGHRFPLLPYPSQSTDIDRGYDIVCPWDLSRLYFVVPLVSAFRTTGHPQYRDRFFAAVDDWERHNPYLFGVNWMCGLDIAIRALNIAIGMMFLGYPEDERRKRVCRLLWAHIVYLQQRDLYESKPILNNHQLIAAAIQVALLQLFTGQDVEAWKRFAREIVRRETKRQFHEDGGNFESAFAYHQFSLEALALSLLFDRASGERDSALGITGCADETCKRLQRAFAFSANYVRTWGEMPQIGDGSDGRIVFHRDYFDWRPTDPAYVKDLSAALFPKDDPFTIGRTESARLFPDSGVGTFVNSRYGVVFTALPVRPPAGGHNHFDQTNVLLRVGRHPVLIDSGTYCYTSDAASRARFRSGRAHNVLLVAKSEPAAVGAREVFAVPDFGDSGIRLDSGDTAVPQFIAYHDAYLRVGICGTVTRRVRCFLDRIEILDRVDGSGDVDAELVFNLHPDIESRLDGDELSLARSRQELARVRVSLGWSVAYEVGSFSPSYRSRRECERIIFFRRVKLPMEVRTSIFIKGQSA